MTSIKPEDIKPGMTIKIFQKVEENKKTRLQQIEGLVLARKHGGEQGATITVRKILDGVGVEWIIPIFSPKINKIELVREAKVKRSKLYFLRHKSQKAIQSKLKTASSKKRASIKK